MCGAWFFSQSTEQVCEGERVLITLLRITGAATLKGVAAQGVRWRTWAPFQEGWCRYLGKPHQGTDYLPDGTSKSLQQVSIYLEVPFGLPVLDT